MAGAVLTQSERELARIDDKNFLAMKTAKGQLKETQALNADLRLKLARMQESIDTLQSQRATAEAQIGRLLDLQERTQAQRDAAQAELNKTLAVVGAARVLRDETYSDKVGNSKYCKCRECALVAAVCEYDAAREAKNG